MRFLNPFPLIPKIAFFHCMVSYADITNIDYMTSKINTWWNIFWLSDKNVILKVCGDTIFDLSIEITANILFMSKKFP